MVSRQRPPLDRTILLLALAAKLLVHLPFISNYGFQRDELLYLALGRHPAAGYWSNPPLIGWISALTQATLGDSVVAVRLVALLTGCAVLVLAVLMARELGGGRWAQALAALPMLTTAAFVRSSGLFQPVVFDIFWWTLLLYLTLRYLNSEQPRWLLGFGAAFGLALLNKYSIGFLLLALVPALLLTPHRRLLWSPVEAGAAALALLFVLPNLWWQYTHGFPVVSHMSELAASQLVNVNRIGFLLDQALFTLPALPLWVPGLIFLFRSADGKYRLLAWHYVFTVALFLLLQGKSYYTIGLYPLLFAAGGVWWEQKVVPAGRWALVAFAVLVGAFFFPFSLPILPPQQMMAFGRYWAERGLDAPLRWEDGQLHPLPQDYADMLGWPEIARLTELAYAQVQPDEEVLIYAENYGQAGAVDRFGRNLPPAVSFSDTYRLWAPRQTNAQTLIYINDEVGEDVQALFADIQLVGKVENPLAREFGTAVHLCRRPRADFGAFWSERVQQVLGEHY